MADVLVNDCDGEVVYDSDDDTMAGLKVSTVGDGSCSMIFRKGLGSQTGKLSPMVEQDTAGCSFNAPSSLGDLDAVTMCYTLNDSQCLKETVCDDGETSRVKDQFSVNNSVKGILSGHIGDMEDNIDGNRDFYSNVESPGKEFLARLDYVDSPEPGELAQVKALEYVNTFLSSVNVTYTQGVSYREIPKAKSPLVSIIKGSQSLVKLIHQRSSTKEKDSFEWVDSQNEVASDIISNKEMMGFSRTSSRFMSHDLKENGYTEEVPETRMARQLIKELDAESSRKQFEHNHIERDVDDEVYDDVFNTQMAAEVMETLSSKSPAKLNEDSRIDPTKDKDQLEQPSFKRKPFSAPGIVSRYSKRFKVPAEQMVLDPYTIRRKLDRAESLTKKIVYCKNNIATNGMCKKSTKPIKQSKRQKSIAGDSNKLFEGNLNLIISVEDTSSITFSPIASRPRQAKPSSLLHNYKKGTNDVPELSIKYPRKKSSAPSIRHKLPKFGSNIPKKARSRKQSPEEQTSLSICASTNCLKLDVWSYPKGKRTSRNPTPVTYFSRKEDICHSANSMNLLKGDDDIKYTCSFQESSGNNFTTSLQRKTVVNSNSSDCPNTDLAALNKQNIPLSQVKVDVCEQSGKLDNMRFTSSVDVAEHNFMPEVLSNEEVKQGSLESNGSFDSTKGSNMESPNSTCYGYHKQPYKKNLPASSLVKELVQLRTPESASNFSLKYTRRRRDMAQIRVLFSQHLDRDMIKHLKKILRRLGSSVASSYLDATHFIADNFSRTRNMLGCIGLGKPVVTHQWLESCAEARCYLDEKNYILRDAKKEKEIRFSMPYSLASASQHPLLKGHKVLITQNVRPDKERITSLAKAVQGQVVEMIQDSMIGGGNILDDLLILSCEEDYSICARFLDKGVAVYSSELLLNGIVIQKLEYERHQLFKCQVKKNCVNRSRKNTNFSHYSMEIC